MDKLCPINNDKFRDLKPHRKHKLPPGSAALGLGGPAGGPSPAARVTVTVICVLETELSAGAINAMVTRLLTVATSAWHRFQQGNRARRGHPSPSAIVT